QNARLGNLPYVCEHATGEVTGEVKLTDFMGEAPRVAGFLQSNSVRLRRDSEGLPGTTSFETPPLSFGLTLGVDAERTTLDFSFRAGLDSRLRVEGTAPFKLVPRGLTAFDESEPFSTFFDVENAPLALILGFIPEFGNVEGIADGWGRFGGT